MPDDDWMLGNLTVEFRDEERRHAVGRIPPECSCLEYGHGMSLTIVHSRECPIHGHEEPEDG